MSKFHLLSCQSNTQSASEPVRILCTTLSMIYTLAVIFMAKSSPALCCSVDRSIWRLVSDVGGPGAGQFCQDRLVFQASGFLSVLSLVADGHTNESEREKRVTAVVVSPSLCPLRSRVSPRRPPVLFAVVRFKHRSGRPPSRARNVVVRDCAQCVPVPVAEHEISLANLSKELTRHTHGHARVV